MVCHHLSHRQSLFSPFPFAPSLSFLDRPSFPSFLFSFFLFLPLISLSLSLLLLSLSFPFPFSFFLSLSLSLLQQ